MRRRLLVASTLLLGSVCAVIYFYGFCNVPMHSPEWITDRLDDVIARGLNYLHETGTFGMKLEDGGEAPTHHFFLAQVLRHHDHPQLLRQMARGRQVNRDNWQWQALSGMPGWPRPLLSALDRYQIKQAVQNSPDNHYWEWIVHALNPNWTSLTSAEQERLFHDTDLLVHSADLTHALLAYLWLEKKAPGIAAKRECHRLKSEVSDRLYRAQTWDARTGDIYNERIAFWLYMEDGPPIKRRWIERVILDQNPDGGWTFAPSAWTTARQMLGLKQRKPTSSPHSTFLALYALTQYREASRSPPSR